jgi:hypothetical protein
MRALTAFFGRLTYANVAATLALVLALSGTAYAASLGKDTVTSKQIKNNSVKTKDIKDGTLTGADVGDGGLSGADVAADSLGGAQVNEGSLGAVADSAALGGIPAASYPRTTPSVAGNFANGSDLTLSVGGFATYRLDCNASTVAFGFNNNSLETGNQAVMITAAGGPLDNAVTRIHNQGGANNATFGHEGDRIYVDAIFRSANGAKAIKVMARGWSTGTNTCFGFIEGQILR